MTYIRDPLGDTDTPFYTWSGSPFFRYEIGRGYHLASDYNWGYQGQDANQEVYSIAAGEVVHIASNYGGYGDAVVVFITTDAGKKFTAVYGHVDAEVDIGKIGYGKKIGTLHDYDFDHLHFAIAKGHTLGALQGYSTQYMPQNTGADGVDYVEVNVSGKNVRFLDPIGFLNTYLNPKELDLPAQKVPTAAYISDRALNIYKTDVVTNDIEFVGNYGIDFTDIAFTPDGALYGVSFSGLYHIDVEAGEATELAGLTGGANALASDKNGILFVGGNSTNVVQRYDPEAEKMLTPCISHLPSVSLVMFMSSAPLVTFMSSVTNSSTRPLQATFSQSTRKPAKS